MLIDWFTVAAQIVNFLILVALLKYFLYGRILQAMEERERAIASKFMEAEAKTLEADRAVDSHRRKILEFEEQRHELFVQTKHEADIKRNEYLEEARREVGEIRLKWRESIERERTGFLKDLRQRAATQVYRITRRALQDLANASLEERLAEMFIQQIQQTHEAPWESILQSFDNHATPLIIQTAFAVPPDLQHRIVSALQNKLAKNIPVTFEVQPEKSAGIELKTPGYTIGWSFEQYLNDLEASLSTALEEELQRQDRIGPGVKDIGTKR